MFKLFQKTVSAFLILSILIVSNGCKTIKPSQNRERKARVHAKSPPTNVTKKDKDRKLKTSRNLTTNQELHKFIEQWKGVPHRMGGNSTEGVDCSGFVIQIYSNVYENPFQNRRARDLFLETNAVKKNDLIEGDLVFFKIRSKQIDHVGIYLSDGNFVHVSSSRGVMISNLNEAYFKKYFFSGGRKKT